MMVRSPSLRRDRQRRDQVAVELDHGERVVLLQQRQRDRALARADLDQALAGLRVDRQHDLLDHAAVVQEVLAELLLRRRLEVAHARLRCGQARAQRDGGAQAGGSASPRRRARARCRGRPPRAGRAGRG
jgi:hypothetical protein